MPFIPPEHHGRPLVMVLLACAGDLDRGDQLVDRLRSIAPPIGDMVRRMPYREVFPPDQEGFHPVAASQTMFGDGVDLGAARSIVDRVEGSNASMAEAHLRALGGAMARVPNDATAFAHRDRPLLVNVAALYEAPEQRESMRRGLRTSQPSLQGAPGAYSGFLGYDGEARIHEAYPEATLNRLVDVKKRYDPDNVFHMNHNFAPAGPRV
jgi:FAD/FMN-containing dehydrogenase